MSPEKSTLCTGMLVEMMKFVNSPFIQVDAMSSRRTFVKFCHLRSDSENDRKVSKLLELKRHKDSFKSS
jgi:hypothetical protein